MQTIPTAEHLTRDHSQRKAVTLEQFNALATQMNSEEWTQSLEWVRTETERLDDMCDVEECVCLNK